MLTEEWKQGRVFHLEFEEDENFYAEITRLVKEKKIKAGSVLVFGAFKTSDIITGFREIIGDKARMQFDDWREMIAIGNISWPEKPPATIDDATWSEPEPYVHLHLALSGPPSKPQEVLVGHLKDGLVKGVFAEISEYI
jgi:predicted DNA-binding protein with PD1-like motif